MIYKLLVVGAGSYYGCSTIRDDDVHKLYNDAIYDMAEFYLNCWSADIYWIYALSQPIASNKALDEMICSSLSIEPSNFEDNIHFLEVGIDLGYDVKPNVVYLRYGGEKVKDKDLRKKIASELFRKNKPNTEFAEYQVDKRGRNFLNYAMRLILAEEDND